MAESTSSEKANVGTGQSAVRRSLDYLLGRNALIGAAALILLCISGYATWHGMSDFILGVQSTGARAAAEPRDIGGLPVTTESLIIVLVVALTFLMWLALRETFGARRKWRDRLVTLPLYLFLAVWSVGFGYGYWWSLIAGTQATQAGLRGQAEDVRDAAVGVAARLEAVKARLDSVVSLSERQMDREASSGGTCGVASGAGRGPLFRAREGVRDSVDALSGNIAGNWLGRVQTDLSELNGRLADANAQLTGATVAERQQQFEAAAADIRGRAQSIAARSDALGASFASEMRALAGELSIAPEGAGFSCFDPALAALLREAAAEAEQPAEVALRPAAFSEGAAGVANAVLNLWTNIGSYAGALGAYVTGSTERAAVSETEGGTPISGRDLIALLAALGVDLGLFALTVLNPPGRPALSPDTADEITRALRVTMDRTGEDREWLKKHLYSHGAHTYLVIPNFYSCLSADIIAQASAEELKAWGELDRPPEGAQALEDARTALLKEVHPDEDQRGQALNLLAGVLTDMRMVQPLGWWQLRVARFHEGRLSRSTITKQSEKTDESITPRNHGLLSKARHALRAAGWSRHARKDVEVFKLVDFEGLSPFLKVFNAATERG